MRVDIQIGRLVFDGVALPAGGEQALRAALEVALTRELAAGRSAQELRSGGYVPLLHGGQVQLEKGTGPAPLARQIARVVAGGRVP